MSLIVVILAFVAGYLSGSVPYGLLLGKFSGLGDIRQSGSGNIGATNVLRVGGKKLAAITLLLDMMKGLVPVLVAGLFHQNYALAAALGAFLGHLFPVWLQFRGGKGVAVAIGIAFALSGKLGLALCLIWVATAVISKYSSLSALLAFAAAPFIAAVLTRSGPVFVVMLLISAMVWFKHKDNLLRLIAGKESKINFKKKI